MLGSSSPHSNRGLEALNRILKYQALNDRRLQRALTELERLQRQRRGDYVPPGRNTIDEASQM